MVELKLTFDTQEDLRRFLEEHEVYYGVSEWLAAVRGELKHGTLGEREAELLEKWRNMLVSCIESYTSLDIL